MARKRLETLRVLSINLLLMPTQGIYYRHACFPEHWHFARRQRNCAKKAVIGSR